MPKLPWDSSVLTTLFVYTEGLAFRLLEDGKILHLQKKAYTQFYPRNIYIWYVKNKSRQHVASLNKSGPRRN